MILFGWQNDLVLLKVCKQSESLEDGVNKCVAQYELCKWPLLAWHGIASWHGMALQMFYKRNHVHHNTLI